MCDDLRVGVFPLHVRQLGTVRDVLHPPEHDVELRILQHAADLEIQLAVGPGVVGIAEREQLATRLGEAAVARRRGTRIVLPERVHPIAEFGDHVRRFVGGTVVDHDDLERPVLLTLDARDRVDEMAPPVVHRRDHAHEGPLRSHRSFAMRSSTTAGISESSVPASSQKHGTARVSRPTLANSSGDAPGSWNIVVGAIAASVSRAVAGEISV